MRPHGILVALSSALAALERLLNRYHAALALILAITMTGVAWTWNTRVASGADAYGYVSEAELWLQGRLQIEQRFALDVPWPSAQASFTPLGYKPSPDGTSIVPTYSPGLPLLMAAAKAVAGQCAIYAVVPALFGLVLFTTYAIGRRLGRPLVGLAAAWLVATSPAMLFMSMWPMSDVPATALWAIATLLVLAETGRSSLAAGLAAAVAILIRPNLVPIAAVMGVWIVWRDVASGRARTWSRACSLRFVAGASVAALVVLALYTVLYGSPLQSGYGSLTEKFALRWIPRNTRNYGTWLLSTETPLAAIGLLSLFVPFTRLWRTTAAKQAAWLFAGTAAVVWGSYLAYLTFNEWWYLRFLLPSWPMMAIGTASCAALLYRSRAPWMRIATITLLLAVGAHGVATAINRDAFDVARQEAVYYEAARAAAAATGPDDVIIARLFSGSTRYYGGRLTLVYTYLDAEWLDRAAEWLSAHGHHPYLLLDQEEVWTLRSTWGSKSRLARLDWTPLVTLRGGEVRLFDAVPGSLNAAPTDLPARLRAPCEPPKPYPTLRTQVGR